MGNLKKNKYIICVYILTMIFLLFNRSSIDRQLSESIKRMEGTKVSNFAPDALALGEITSDAVLRQELMLPPGVLQIGIRFGTYIRENDSNYQIILYDNEGNVVAKRRISANKIRDNQTNYITLYGKTSGKTSYVLEISSSDAALGNAITGYGVPIQMGHSSCTFGGKDTGKELEIELIIQKVFPLTSCLMALVTFCLIAFILRKKMVSFIKGVISGSAKIWAGHKRKIIYANLVISVIGLVLAFFLKEEEYFVLPDSSMEKEEIVCPYNEKMTRNFQSTQDFEAIEIKLATYLKTYQQGKLHFALYEEAGGKLLMEKEILAAQIEDNKLLRFEFDRISVSEPAGFYFELYTQDFGEQILGVYCSEENGEIQYQLLQVEKVPSSVGIMIYILWGMLWLTVYIYTCAKIKERSRQLIVVSIISIFAGLLFSTYANYKSMSLEALTKNIGLSVKGEYKEYDRKKIEDCTSRIYRYDAKGGVNLVFDQIVLEEVRTRVDTIELWLERTEYTKRNTLAVYIDQGNGFSAKSDMEYEYVDKGQEKVIIPIKNCDNAEQILISYNMTNENGIAEEILENGYRYYELNKIVLNEKRLFWYDSWKSMLAGIILVWLVFVWKKYKVECALERWLKAGKYREAKIFFGLAVVFGMIFSNLLPALQVPDEPVHMKWAFDSIGADKLYEQSMEIITTGVSGVSQNGAVTVDADAYREIFKQKLDSYRFSFQLNMGVLNYPGQVLGILLGILLHLPVGWILFLAEFFALLLYAAVGAAAISVVPIKKELFMMILLMPMAIQQAGSFSYDSFNNAVAALTIAYLLYLALQKEKVGFRELIRAAGMLFILLWIKKVYVVCGILIFLIPVEKYQIHILKKKIEFKSKKAKMLLVGVLGVGVLFFGIVSVLILARSNAITTILNAVQYPKELGRLFLDTVIVQKSAWIKQASALFGWLDGIIYGWIVTVLEAGLVSAAIVKKEDLELWNWKKYSVCVVVFIVSMAGIILSMVGWSALLQKTTGEFINQILLFSTIEGVQGRYFLPVLVLLFLFPVAEWVKKLKKYIPVYLIMILALFISGGYSVYILLQRYWIS